MFKFLYYFCFKQTFVEDNFLLKFIEYGFINNFSFNFIYIKLGFNFLKDSNSMKTHFTTIISTTMIMMAMPMSTTTGGSNRTNVVK